MRNKSKLIYNWGVNDSPTKIAITETIDGKSKIVWRCPYYSDWVSILARCFDTEYQQKYPTYKNATVCEEWKYLSNFIKWVDSQPNRDWINCVPDKDLLVDGNKHYSPETVVYISEDINLFLSGRSPKDYKYLIGVTPQRKNKTNPYQATCQNPFKTSTRHVGMYSTELEAHKAWQAKKHEYACIYADLQEDSRVAEALRQRYSPDKDWTIRK